MRIGFIFAVGACAWCIVARSFFSLLAPFSSPAGKTRRSLFVMMSCQGLFHNNSLDGITPDYPQQAKVMLGLIEQETKVWQGPC